MARIKVKQTDPPTPIPVLAESIVKIGKAAAELKKSGLNEVAVVVLLHDLTKVPKGQIKTILNGMRQLEAWYCRSK